MDTGCGSDCSGAISAIHEDIMGSIHRKLGSMLPVSIAIESRLKMKKNLLLAWKADSDLCEVREAFNRRFQCHFSVK